MEYLHKQEVLLGLLNRVNREIQSGMHTGIQGCNEKCLYRFDPLFDRIEAGAYLGFEPGTLAVWDCTKRYNLNRLKIGRDVRYRLSSLNKFSDDQINSTY